MTFGLHIELSPVETESQAGLNFLFHHRKRIITADNNASYVVEMCFA